MNQDASLTQKGLDISLGGWGVGSSHVAHPGGPGAAALRPLKPKKSRAKDPETDCVRTVLETQPFHQAPKGTSSMVPQAVQVHIHWELYTRSSGGRVVFRLWCTEQQKDRQSFMLPGLLVALAACVNYASLMAPERRILTIAQEPPLPFCQARTATCIPDLPKWTMRLRSKGIGLLHSPIPTVHVSKCSAVCSWLLDQWQEDRERLSHPVQTQGVPT